MNLISINFKLKVTPPSLYLKSYHSSQITNQSIFIPCLIPRTIDFQQAALHTISTAMTHPTIGPITIWKSTWHATPQHAPASYHYEEGFSSPDTSTYCSISTKFSDIWTRTIGKIEARLSSRTIISSFLSHWTKRHQTKMLVHQLSSRLI